MAERDPPKLPSDVVYSRIAVARLPWSYFDIIGAFGTMNGSIEWSLRRAFSFRSRTAAPR